MANYLETKDYSQFKTMLGQRAVSEARVQKIIDSVNKHGQTKSVIVVNENMEVIDGQHRLEAFKRLGLPIYYMVIANANINDCILMNACMTPWDSYDFILSHSSRGNSNYQALKEIIELYPELSINTVLNVISRKATGVARTIKTNRILKEGNFKFPFESKRELMEEFDYLKKFTLVRAKNKNGRTDIFYSAVAACYECEYINNDKLLQRMTENTEKFGAFNSFKDCLERIQDVYNLYARSKTYVAHEVTRMLDMQKASSSKHIAD